MKNEVYNITFERVLEQAEQLSNEDKARLIGSLWAAAGLLELLGKNCIHEFVNKMDEEELSKLLHAIAERVRSNKRQVI